MTGRDESRIHIDGLKPADVALLKDVAAEAAHQAVSEALIALGIDPKNPFDAQADMQFLRSTRERCEKAGFKAFLTLIGLTAAGAATMLWVGFKSMVIR